MSSTFASADSKTLSIGYVDGWSDSVATTHVAAEVIKQKLGYDVKLQAVATGIMWQGVATGKLDAMLSAWLPVTHGEYWAKNKDKVVDYGPNFKDAKIGLIVPEYVKAKSSKTSRPMKASRTRSSASTPVRASCSRPSRRSRTTA
jgi:glycine betaine/proline transport system substrate-binding protein